MNLHALGKKSLFFGGASLIGLSLSLRILEAHSPEQKVLYKNLSANDYLNERSNTLLELQGKAHSGNNKDYGVLFPVTSAEAKAIFKKTKHSGKPFAYFSNQKLYGIDEEGRILGLANSLPHLDLPVLTGTAYKMDLKKQRLAGAEFEETVQLLQGMENMSHLLYNQISEIHFDKEIGMIAYLNVSRPMPVIIGIGSCERKVAYLDAFLEHLGSSGLLEQARYLDVRIAGQIIVKKKS
jgi:hypothetical protein